MFTGLGAFPLTPLRDGAVDEAAFARLVERLAAAGVDSICALGSTGNYAYLDLAERKRVARLAVRHAGGVPVIVGIGALSMRDVLELAEDAQRAGAGAVLLAPMSYQRLADEEVFGLYEAVTQALSVPLVVYDNPGTTHFEFSDALHGRIARLPHVASIKSRPWLWTWQRPRPGSHAYARRCRRTWASASAAMRPRPPGCWRAAPPGTR